jgi:hypothetical protein
MSWNFWWKGHATVHVDDILVNDPSYYMTLPELWDFGAAKFTLRNLAAVCPMLSIHGGDLVYLVLKVGIHDDKAWVAGIDLRKKTVEVLEPYCAARSSLCQPPFLACTFSGYLNTTPRYIYLQNDMNLSDELYIFQNFRKLFYPMEFDIFVFSLFAYKVMCARRWL